MADWNTPLAALAAAIAPNSDADAIMTAFATPILLTSYDVYAHTLTGAIGSARFPSAQQVTVTTAKSATASYAVGPGLNAIGVSGVDFQGQYCADTLVLTQASGGETVATQALFSQVTQILIHPQADANGSFQFGIVNAPSPAEIAGAQALMGALQTAGSAYDFEVQSVGAANYLVTAPSQLAPGTGPQVFTGLDASGASVSSYSPIPVAPASGPVSANDLYRACRYLVISAGLQSPSWPFDYTHVIYLPPFNIDTPADPNDVMGQLNGTWPACEAFVDSQTTTLPLVAAQFLSSTLRPLIARARVWAQYLRDFPAVTWTGSPPVVALELLAAADPALLAVQAAIAGANAYLAYIQTP